MSRIHPVYTETAECQDCYKCVRYCPVKSIKITDHHAAVIEDDCTLCGYCVTVCPSGAKKSRNDIEKVKSLLHSGKKVILSLAPSYRAAFPELSASDIIGAVKSLGFSEVSETALGAESVSRAVAGYLSSGGIRLSLSTACPAAVRYIKRYKPELTEYFTPFPSPLVAHSHFLKETIPGAVVVFVGPCIAKKDESDLINNNVDAAITFEELNRLFTEKGIIPGKLKGEENFFPFTAGIGGLYPVDGGMIRGIAPIADNNKVQMITVSGLDNICKSLETLKQDSLGCNLFIELLACSGGCINGPRIGSKGSHLNRALAIESRNENSLINDRMRSAPYMNVSVSKLSESVIKKHSISEISEILKSIGKIKPEDELNCGGCGYNDCRSLAAALLEGKAEDAMCVSYMRKLAQQKANGLIKALPLGVVMVDSSLNIIDCNKSFESMFGRELPVAEYFAGVLRTGEDIVGREIAIGNKIYRLTLFPVEQKRIAGAVIMDITEPSLSKEAVIDKAQQVIDRQMATVQKIACLLGENAAETEILLKSLITAFTVKQDEK
ncbi:MAG: 4Fe-4S binding protein [Fibrobacteres bacterium]|nr:4Fe-4S binding protein [Fibrobacterota bacterium]